MDEVTERPWTGAARPGRRVGHRVEAHGAIGSTNDRARELLDERDGPGTAVVAEVQLAGRGRRGRTWISPAGRNLTLSVGLRLDIPVIAAPWLALAVALAVRDAMAAVAPIGMKWPNDLVDGGGRKLGGILVETSLVGDRVATAIVGIGINVNWPRDEMPPELRDTATSLGELAGGPVDRVALLGRILETLDAEIASVEAGRSPVERYRPACVTLGDDVEVAVGDRVVRGRAVDVGDDGALLLASEAGVERLSNGEVTRVRSGVRA